MATLHVQHLILSTSSSSSSSSSSSRPKISANLHTNAKTSQIHLPKLPTKTDMETQTPFRSQSSTKSITQDHDDTNLVISKLYAIAAAAADRAEMHGIIGVQRDNWGYLLLNSTNSITLTASLMAGIASIDPSHLLAFKLSSAFLFTVAAGIMAATNKIQPSQLAEEQRNAKRLFRQLERSIDSTLALRSTIPVTEVDVAESMERLLALDKAYPLILLPGMLEKFPETVEPTVWWPKQNQQRRSRSAVRKTNNGWSKELEDEMKGVLQVLKKKDTAQYLMQGEVMVQINRTLAVAGPLLAGLAAVGAGFVGASPQLGQWPAVIGVASGALAVMVNALEHGGQVGMVFEMFRNCAGFYRLMEEEIEGNLMEGEVERREDGEMFEMRMALKLGRSLSEMKDLKVYADGEDVGELAGKLF